MKKNSWIWAILIFLLVIGYCSDKSRVPIHSKKTIKKESLKLNTEGILYMKNGQLDIALKKFDKAIYVDKNNEFAYINKGAVYKLKGQYDKAIKNYDRAILINPDNLVYHSNKAALYFDAGKPEEAIVLCNKIININPKALPAYLIRLSAHIFLEKYDEVEDDLEKINELDPDNEFVDFGRGVIDFHKGMPEKAIVSLKKSLEKGDNKTIISYIYIGKCYEALGNKQEAISYYKQYIDSVNKYPEIKKSFGFQTYLKEAIDKAAKLKEE